MSSPLMPVATAVWLIDNTSLTFKQVGAFCGMHPAQVQGIADGEVSVGIVGRNPVSNGELTQEELDRCQKDSSAHLQLSNPVADVPQPRRRGGRYTPVSRRGDRPDAIAWLIKFHPELPDSKIGKLLGTTKTTISAVREKSHWNSQSIKPRDPVSLGICTQMELDETVKAYSHLRNEGDTDKLMEEVAASVAADAASVPLTAYERKKRDMQREETYDHRAEAEAVFGKTSRDEEEAKPSRAEAVKNFQDLFKTKK